MKKRSRWGLVLVVLAAGGIALAALGCGLVFWVTFIGIEQDAVTMPQMSITVVDEDGTAVPGADVVIEHRTEPHGQLHARTELLTDADGRLSTRLEMETERILPLCMHGVPWHRHYVCVNHPGATPVILEVESTEETVRATIALRRDPSNTHDCSQDLDHLELMSRTDRPDVLTDAAHVTSAGEP